VLLKRPGEYGDVKVGEAEVEPSQNVVHEALKSLGGVRRRKDTKGNSKRPNGMVMAVFCISSGCTGILLYAFTKSILEKAEHPKS
jgi:hypothetical protein